MARVFISYSRTDQEFARKLAASLSGLGIDVWIDLEDIPAGMKWSSAIQDGLRNADLMLVIISPDSMASVNVEDEWQYYIDRGKPVLPVRWRPADVHFQLNRLQYIDFHQQPYDESFKRLVGELKRKGLKIDPTPEEIVANTQAVPRIGESDSFTRPTTTAAPQKGRGAVMIGAVIGLLLIGVIGVMLVSSNQNNALTSTESTLTAIAQVVAQLSATATQTNSATATETTAARPSSTSTDAPTHTATPTHTSTDAPTRTPTQRPPGYDLSQPVTANNQWAIVRRYFEGFEMVLVPVGSFKMGINGHEEFSLAHSLCPLASGCDRLFEDETRQLDVTISQPFWIDRYEYPAGDGVTPMTNVSVEQAAAYCEARGGRLPTEAEWEYAARGPSNFIFPWGNNLDGGNLLNVCDVNCEYADYRTGWLNDRYATTAPITGLPDGASWVGAFNMAGNVWEWTSSVYTAQPNNDPPGTDYSAPHTLKGSSWNWIPSDARASSRDDPVRASSDWYGFRCIREYNPNE